MNAENQYQEWSALANDPRQTEAARIEYREKMSAYLHEQLRKAFQLAASRMPGPGHPPAD